MTKYDVDFHAWAVEQAEALKRRSANEIDWDNLAEELASLSRQEAWELYNRYVVLLTHLLKWIYQPAHRSKSWRNSIAIQRREIAKHLRRNPSLKSVESQEFADAFATARLQASTETGLAVEALPEKPPFSPDQSKDSAWWPDEDGGNRP